MHKLKKSEKLDIKEQELVVKILGLPSAKYCLAMRYVKYQVFGNKAVRLLKDLLKLYKTTKNNSKMKICLYPNVYYQLSLIYVNNIYPHVIKVNKENVMKGINLLKECIERFPEFFPPYLIIGERYFNGVKEIIEIDKDKGIEYFEKGVEKGCGDCAFKIANINLTNGLHNGDIVERYTNKAIQLFKIMLEKDINDQDLKHVADGIKELRIKIKKVEKFKKEFLKLKKCHFVQLKSEISFQCAYCGKSDKVIKLLVCSRCKTRYCCRKCQQNDWKFHKKFCKLQKTVNYFEFSDIVEVNKVICVHFHNKRKRFIVKFKRKESDLSKFAHLSFFLITGYLVKTWNNNDQKYFKFKFSPSGQTAPKEVKWLDWTDVFRCEKCSMKCKNDGVLILQCLSLQHKGCNWNRVFPRLFHLSCVKDMCPLYPLEKLISISNLTDTWKGVQNDLLKFDEEIKKSHMKLKQLVNLRVITDLRLWMDLCKDDFYLLHIVKFFYSTHAKVKV